MKITIGSGNVFRDLELPDAEATWHKVQLLHQINRGISDQKLNQEQTIELLGVDKQKMLTLRRGKLSALSIEELHLFCAKLAVNFGG